MKKESAIIFKLVCLGVFSISLLTAIAAEAGAQKKDPLRITRVGLDRKSFNPSNGEKAALGFEISKPGDVQVAIYNRLGEKVCGFNMAGLKAGRHSITWDGHGPYGPPAAGNVFLYVIEATTKDGEKFVYNEAAKTGGIEMKPLKYTMDKNTGRIEYVLPKAGMVRIRAGLKDGMFGKSMFHWKPHTAGRHTYQWDGMDNSGMMNLLRHPELELRLRSYTLPANTVIITGKVKPLKSGKEHLENENPGGESVWATKSKNLHYRHDPRICHPPRFTVSFPGSKEEGNGAPVVSGIVPVRVELDKHDVWHLTSTRYEIMIFVDGVYIYEIEEGSSPFTFNWDTRTFAKGPHVMTVNVLGYDDHIGIVSRRIFIK